MLFSARLVLACVLAISMACEALALGDQSMDEALTKKGHSRSTLHVFAESLTSRLSTDNHIVEGAASTNTPEKGTQALKL
jgi:hypothetical protein